MTFFSTLASDALKHNGRAIAMAEMASFEREKNWQGAADSCQQLLHRYGDDFFLWDHFVFQQFQLQQQGRALVGLAKLLALKKNYSRGQLYRASALSRVGRFDEAIENLTDILCRDDADKKNLCETAINLAMNYHIVGNSEKSLEAIAMAAQFRDEYGGSEQDVQKRQAFCWLHAGDYKKGFAAYEYRHDQQDPNYFQQLPHHKPENRWQGEAITDDILLVAMEQGLGDMIWHARFLPLLQHKCKKIIVACYQELYRLFRSSPMAAGIEVVLSTNRPPPFDKWVRMMSLPHLLGVDQHNVPQQLPYLWPPVDAAKLPNNYFTQDDNLLRIGLVWQSGDRGLDRANRSCALTDIATLLEVPGCRFYSFQYESDEHKIKNEIESLGLGAYIDDTRPLIKDMADTASLLQAMDLLITVDTAVAHLMGALRRPVWVLLPFETSWKWHRGAQSIWYPEVMTLFRQRAVGDWLIPIAEIKTELNNIVAAINQRRTARKGDSKSNQQAKEILLNNWRPAIHATATGIPSLPKAHEMFDRAAAMMNSKKYMQSAIYLRAYLRQQNIPADVEKNALLNLRNGLAAGTNDKARMRAAVGVNDLLLARGDTTPDEQVGYHLQQSLFYQKLWHAEDAVAAAEKAEQILDANPNIRPARVREWQKQAMFAYLRAGDYRRAWPIYEQRHAGIVSYQALQLLPHHEAQKKWQGRNIDAARDATILVVMEQGYGDIIQFARFIFLLARRCKKIIVEAYPALFALFQQTLRADNITVIMRESAVPQFDHWLLVCSLPYVLGIDQHNLHDGINFPYLRWPQQGGGHEVRRRRVGLNWSSGILGKDHRTKSTSLAQLSPLLQLPDIDFYSLQMDGGAEMAWLGVQAMVHDAARGMSNFLQTAQLLAGLDDFITIDSAPAHLAGAMGVRTHLLLTKNCDWRWDRVGQESRWYPASLLTSGAAGAYGAGGAYGAYGAYGVKGGMRLYRQKKENDWSGVVAEIGATLMDEA